MSRSQDQLNRYRGKRDFRSTAEPRGRAGKKSSRPIFVVQKHDATSLHYDFRLEVDGVLKSWAVPRGPSLNPKVRRLAIATEDHPIKYASFEGVIPEGEYGGGSVLVWDKGSFKNLTEDKGEPVPAADALAGGRLSFRLMGKKLKGSFALTRFGGKSHKQDKWLLIKQKDEYADARRNPVSSQPKSVLSGRKLREIGGE